MLILQNNRSYNYFFLKGGLYSLNGKPKTSEGLRFHVLTLNRLGIIVPKYYSSFGRLGYNIRNGNPNITLKCQKLKIFILLKLCFIHYRIDEM